MSVTVTEVRDRAAWDRAVSGLGGHPLQLWGWGSVKEGGPWTARRIQVADANGAVVGLAQVLVRHLPAPFKALAYVPRGPVVGPDGVGSDDDRAAVAHAVVDWCTQNAGAIGVTFEPDWAAGTALGLPAARPGRNTILYPSTLILDLGREPDALLADMRKSTRYEIRKAARDGLVIRRITTQEEVRQVLDVYRTTAQRAGFVLHDDEYYLAVHRELGDASRLVSAFDEDGNPCCFAWAVASGETAFLLYGGANEAGRRLRATAAVYWASIEDARAKGVRRYDLNGLLNDGIGEFKRSFAKHEDELVGSWDVPLNRPLYALWERALPAAKKAVRAVRSR
ncbi:lipid II:glycine glycyltransferase FemX [Xylanimonas allomyrinae]|nr:peptidoglycan bridge formation glycyltransferase FemA/FemB family protein [Xylanimonas allomyrinae]